MWLARSQPATMWASVHVSPCFFFFNDTATTEIYTLSLHDALPICRREAAPVVRARALDAARLEVAAARIVDLAVDEPVEDRKSTRLNSSHDQISYAVFCLKKKNGSHHLTRRICYYHGHDALPAVTA